MNYEMVCTHFFLLICWQVLVSFLFSQEMQHIWQAQKTHCDSQKKRELLSLISLLKVFNVFLLFQLFEHIHGNAKNGLGTSIGENTVQHVEVITINSPWCTLKSWTHCSYKLIIRHVPLIIIPSSFILGIPLLIEYSSIKIILQGTLHSMST